MPGCLAGTALIHFLVSAGRSVVDNVRDLTIYPAINRDATRYNWERKREIFSKSRLYITTVSHWLAQKVQDSLLKGVSCKVIPNGIDLTIFHPGDKRSARDSLAFLRDWKVVLYAANGGRNSPWRNFGQLEASLLQIAGPEIGDLRLICIGELKSSQETLSNGLRVQYRLFEGDAEPHGVVLSGCGCVCLAGPG